MLSAGEYDNGSIPTGLPVEPHTAAPVLEAVGLSKSYGPLKALNEVSLSLHQGTLHAIVGHNGAGKSTLMRVLSGVIRQTAGDLVVAGEPVILNSPRQAQERGIAMVHQELSILDDLTVAENILLGREPCNRAGLIDRKRMLARAREVLDQLDLRLAAETPCGALSVGERQMVEIARAVSFNARVLILDEPTAALSRREQEALFQFLARIKPHVGIFYISHRLDEIIQLADIVTVLRDGRNVGSLRRGAYDHSQLVEMMLGRSFAKSQSAPVARPDALLTIDTLTAPAAGLHGVSLGVGKGEIVGLAGMLGSGRSELFECIFGMRPIESGAIIYKGAPYAPGSPANAMRRGIGLVPEDRKALGIFAGTETWRNIAVASYRDRFSKAGFVAKSAALAGAARQIKRLGIRVRSPHQDISLLSGGNQQKAIVGRWLLREPDLLLLDEPTAGIDIGAKNEIYALIRDLSASGVAILIASSEFDELIGLCHRILVMSDGRIAQEFDGANVSEHALLLVATGGGYE